MCSVFIRAIAGLYTKVLPADAEGYFFAMWRFTFALRDYFFVHVNFLNDELDCSTKLYCSLKRTGIEIKVVTRPEPWPLFIRRSWHYHDLLARQVIFPKNYSGRNYLKKKKSIQVCHAGILHLKRTACYLLLKNADKTEALRYLIPLNDQQPVSACAFGYLCACTMPAVD